MKRLICSVYDSKAQAYLPPFVAATAAVATRMLVAAMENRESEFWRFAEDYQLFELAFFDDESGQVEGHSGPISIVGCWQLKAAFKQSGDGG